MKHFILKKFIALVVLCLSLAQAQGQNVVWSENFGGGAIPATWTNVDASGQVTTVWQWSTAGAYFGAQPPFSSPTAANGFVIFNSDAAGPLGTVHDVRLTTGAIDCSTLSTVIVKFSNQYAFYSAGGVSIPELGVSTNGTTFTYYPILANVLRNDLSASEQVEEVDVTAQAAGQSTVYLRFRWRGNYEYTWRIDDIKVQDGATPPLQHNTAISSYLLPNTHQTPVSQIDTIFLAGAISNLGAAAQSNVSLTAKVKNAFNATIFTETVTINTLPAGYVDSVINFNGFVTASDLNKGEYILTYTLTQDSTDLDADDNEVEFGFVISDSTFAVDNGNFIGGFASGSGANGEGAYAVGNYYYVPNGQFQATSAAFAISNPNDLAAQSVDIFLYRLDENGDGDLDENGDGEFNGMDLTNSIKGFANYTFAGNEPANSLITVSLENFSTTGAPIELDEQGDYAVVLQYSGTDAMYFTGAEPIEYDNLNTIAIDTDSDTWYLGGFQSGILAVIRLNIQTLTATKPVALAQTAVSVFPNPTTDVLNVRFDLENNSSEVKLVVTDIAGRTLVQKHLQNISKETTSINVKDLASGTYFLNIATENGTTTKRFVVKK